MGRKKHEKKSRLPRYKAPRTNVPARTDSGFGSHQGKHSGSGSSKKINKGKSKPSKTSSHTHRPPRHHDADRDSAEAKIFPDDTSKSSPGAGPTTIITADKPIHPVISHEREAEREREVLSSSSDLARHQPPQHSRKHSRGKHQLGVDIIELIEASKMWLDYSRNNFGMFAKTAYEYNIFVDKHQRLLLATPVVGVASENVSDSRKPKYFAINTPHGREVCRLHYKTGNCFRRSTSIKVTMDNEFIGGVKQKKNKLIVTEQGGNELFEVHGIPILGLCNQLGPDQFTSNVYFPGGSQVVGAIGRNGSLISDVLIGEPSGFYFLAKHSNAMEFDMLHKVLILSILISLMTQYSD